MIISRRSFLGQISAVAASSFVGCPDILAASKPLFFDISLAQWSLHRALETKKISTLDFPGLAKRKFGIAAVEYVDTFMKNDPVFLKELLRRSKDEGVSNHLLMIDTAGNLVDADQAKRLDSVTKHYTWAESAKFLGCKTIRVNLRSSDDIEEVRRRSIESLGLLAERIRPLNTNVVVENHGGHSSDGAWMASVAKSVGLSNCGLLPDFGNFCISDSWGTTQKGCDQIYDRYEGVSQMLPYAKGGLSAKSYDFDANGNETKIDYPRLLKIAKQAGFTGYIGIEFEGEGISEDEGIRKTKALLEKEGRKLS